MPDQYKEDMQRTESESVGAEAQMTQVIIDQREFDKRILSVNKLVEELSEKAIVLGGSRNEYDSVLETSRNVAIMAHRKKTDLHVSQGLLPGLKEAQDKIGQETLGAITRYFEDVLEKIESLRRNIAAENGAGYLTKFDDKPEHVRRDLIEIMKAMREGKSVNRKIISHPLDPHGGCVEKGRVLLNNGDSEATKISQFNYVLKVLTQLDGDILESLKTGGRSENIAKLILLKASEQCQLMSNEFAGQFLQWLKIDEKEGDFMGESEIEKMMFILEMTEKALFSFYKGKEALRWLE